MNSAVPPRPLPSWSAKYIHCCSATVRTSYLDGPQGRLRRAAHADGREGQVEPDRPHLLRAVQVHGDRVPERLHARRHVPGLDTGDYPMGLVVLIIFVQRYDLRTWMLYELYLTALGLPRNRFFAEPCVILHQKV